LLNAFHSKGVNVIASAFQCCDDPTGQDPWQTCSNLADFVLNNNLDGVDIDYETSSAFDSAGTGENWLITCTQALRSKLPACQYIITHAPQAPYFVADGNQSYPYGAYLTVDANVGNLIDWYNVQYYNQGGDEYTTYESLIVSDSDFPGTAAMQINPSTTFPIAVGKPVTSSDAETGWNSASDLSSWFQKAQSELGFCGGAMWWEFGDDTNGEFGNTLKQGLSTVSQNCQFSVPQGAATGWSDTESSGDSENSGDNEGNDNENDQEGNDNENDQEGNDNENDQEGNDNENDGEGSSDNEVLFLEQ